MNQLVIGWGNPIVGDDGIGPRAAELISQRVDSSVHVKASSRGALRVVEDMRGYDRVLIADARFEDGCPDLSTEVIRPHELDSHDHALRHDGSLVQALHAFRNLNDSDLPREVVLLSVPIPAPTAWSSELSPEGEVAAQRLADAVIHEVEVTAVV